MRPNLCLMAAVLLILGAAIPAGPAAVQEYSTRLITSLSVVGGDETALSWAASGVTRTIRPAPSGNVDALFRSSLGQARSDGDTRKTVDRIGADLRCADELVVQLLDGGLACRASVFGQGGGSHGGGGGRALLVDLADDVDDSGRGLHGRPRLIDEYEKGGVVVRIQS